MSESVQGRLLVASPTLLDANFHRTVVLMIEHGPHGAMGLVINRASRMPVDEPLPGWRHLAAEPGVVFHVGPLEVGNVVCLAQGREPGGPGYRPLFDELGTLDLNRSADDVVGIDAIRLFAGHASWGPDQLDGELDLRAWIVVDREAGDAFTPQPDQLWADVLARQPGIVALLASYPEDVNLN